VVLGAAAAFLVGPRRAIAVIVPTVAAVVALWAIGHRSGLEVGPTVELFGFRVALLFDVLVGATGAILGAVLQRLALSGWRRLSPPARR
jgi:hypothetical protein